VDNENKIVGYSILESQETPGIGSRIGDPEFVDSVIGKSMEKELSAVKKPQADNEIQALSGATYSTTAAKNALNVSQKANAGLK
ncbi:MAG: FMN-binding protein, partial [Finegoldia magna]